MLVGDEQGEVYAKKMKDGIWIYPVTGAKDIIEEAYGSRLFDATAVNGDDSNLVFLYTFGSQSHLSVKLEKHIIKFREVTEETGMNPSESDVSVSSVKFHENYEDDPKKNTVMDLEVLGLKINSVKYMNRRCEYVELDIGKIPEKIGGKYFDNMENFLKNFQVVNEYVKKKFEHDRAVSHMYQ